MAKKQEKKSEMGLVITKGGAFKANINRLQYGLQKFQGPVAVLEWDEDNLWCGGQYTSRELRGVLARMESEGMSLRQALESLGRECPPVPSYWTVMNWLQIHPEFKSAHLLAKAIREEMLAEAAAARGALEAPRKVKKV